MSVFRKWSLTRRSGFRRMPAALFSPIGQLSPCHTTEPPRRAFRMQMLKLLRLYPAQRPIRQHPPRLQPKLTKTAPFSHYRFLSPRRSSPRAMKLHPVHSNQSKLLPSPLLLRRPPHSPKIRSSTPPHATG